MAVEDIARTIWWDEEQRCVMLVDQSRLPLVGDLLVCNTADGVCLAIAGMAVRGAPALGVAAALAIALWAANEAGEITGTDEFLAGLDAVAAKITATRPTAVNLFWGAERMRALARANAGLPLPELRELLVAEAVAMEAEDEERNRAIGAYGAELLGDGPSILTHCNAGSLATAFYGTALGVIFAAQEAGKNPQVWVDETRPVLQGARLTAWELRMAGVPFRLITDNMAASVMKSGWVDAVIVGADRIAANGDVANKIGTYGLAVLCREHGIPFYVAAPTSTIDLTLPSGDGIVIEERDPREVLGVTFSGVFEPRSAEEARAWDILTQEDTYVVPFTKGHAMEVARKGAAYQVDGWVRLAPPGIEVYNPAFDVTPAEYVTAIITESGVARPDFAKSLTDACSGSGAIHEIGGQPLA
jgi:methylthioribose-1-phosphate isomerase